MRDILWGREKLEFRFVAAANHKARYTLDNKPRPGSGSLFHQPYDHAAFADLSLPGALLPCITHDGTAVDVGAVAKEFGVAVRAAEIARPGSYANDDRALTATKPFEVIPAVWMGGIEEARADEIRARARMLSGIYVRADETVIGLGNGLLGPTWIQRLPRVVLHEKRDLADNTDGGLSMAQLLEDFVRRFLKSARPRQHVRIATGYLYQAGLHCVLQLLENPGISVQLLFSGQTDRPTASVLTAVFAKTMEEEMDSDEGGALYERCRNAAEIGRFEVRMYTDAFLHAKLFIGYDERRDDRNRVVGGYAVVGSSNVSRPGLQHGGNLELDVGIEVPERVTELSDWFEHRWEEASPPDPALLEVLEHVRPLPPPTFSVEGLEIVWRAGISGKLVTPDAHLSLLAQIHAAELERLYLPTDAAFEADDRRTIKPTPEQWEGVTALVQRLQGTRIAFLADSVGLGKTITALGFVAYTLRHGLAKRIALIAPAKLWDQWRLDADRVRIAMSSVKLINRHILERRDAGEAKQELSGFDVLIVEEAHEALRNRSNKLWQHIRGHLARNVECRLLLISATPWNNRREDIYNFLLLAWNDGKRLNETYTVLGTSPIKEHIPLFQVTPYWRLSASAGARSFEGLGRDPYSAMFGQVFVQRTRSSLEKKTNNALDFPERRVHPHNTPPSNNHDSFFADLASALARLTIPYREPFHAFLRAAPNGSTDKASNLHNSFIIQLSKRAESSLFALAVSLAGVRRRLDDFAHTLKEMRDSATPKAALATYLDQTYLRLDDDVYVDDLHADPEQLTAAEKARYSNLHSLLGSLDDRQARELLDRVLEDEVDADIKEIDRLRTRLDFALDEQSPKELVIARITREAHAFGFKPILIAGFADTATRTFLRLVDLLPDASIALALGGGEAWVYWPGKHFRRGMTEEEWQQAQQLDSDERRKILLGNAGRAVQVPRENALAAFAPKAKSASPGLLAASGGKGREIDILVGSEAISVGQNLQDSTCMIQLDLPWNPMVIEQRIGRIDRRGGGRIDPTRSDGRRIVDVHYVWSDAAIEQEVGLRNRLLDKASRAIEDTEFDELLLYELYDKIQKARADKTAREAAAESVFNARQRQEVDDRARGKDVRAGAIGEADGLRRLAAWRKDQDHIDQVKPVVAATMTFPRAKPGFLLTLGIEPIDRRGQPIPGGPLSKSLPIFDGAPLEVDLDTVVDDLTNGTLAAARPSAGRRVWTTALQSLEQQIKAFGQALLEDHNREVKERMQQQATPAARREPSETLRMLMPHAKDALRAAIKRVQRDSPREKALVERKDKVKCLLEQGLNPMRLAELLAHRSDTSIQQALVHIRDFPDRALDDDFDRIFDDLCGPFWAGQEMVDLPELDGFWADLRVRVLAATWVVPGNEQ